MTQEKSKPSFTPGQSLEMYEALSQLVHLHLCEQEGISSGMPTSEQWMEAVNKACDVLEKVEGEEL